MGVVPQMGIRNAQIIVGCCLLAAVSGCAFHRTDQGFVLRSPHWSLEHYRESPDSSKEETPDNPELLAWRSRLKGYHLGSRIFHGRQSVDEAATPETSSGELQSPDTAPPVPQSNRPDLVVD
jgi:hypothetical protein